MEKTKERSRRLRKKLYLGEFSILGFSCSCKVNVHNEADFDSFLDDFIEYIEGRNLMVGGGGSPENFEMFLCSEEKYGSASEEDREALNCWLKNHSLTSSVIVSELVDTNHGI